MLEFNLQSLEKYHQNTEVVHLTARQIMKDFAMFGMEITFSGNVAYAYHELMEQMATHISSLLRMDNERLFALMYQIDINKASIEKCLHENMNSHIAIADLVIRREMMKVLTVQYFKHNKKKD